MVHGRVWDEALKPFTAFHAQADQKAREVVRERQGAYVHPFDQVETIQKSFSCLSQESTWRGHATLVEDVF